MKKIVFIALLLFTKLSFANVPYIFQKCFTEHTPISAEKILDWKYCIYTSEGSKNHDVLYQFHGRGDSDIENHGWSNPNTHSYFIRDQWEFMGFDAPTVVSITFGDTWLLVEKNQSPASGLYDFVSKLAIPKIEAEISKSFKITNRELLGFSMGGFNASQLLLKFPQGYFKKTALVCPAISTLSPFSDEKEVSNYVATTGADYQHVQLMIQLSRYFMPTPEDFQKSSPLSLAQTNLNSNSGELYVSCGDKDEYGFFTGAEQFYQTAAAKGVSAVWDPVHDVGHCALHAVDVAKFFAK